MQPLDDIFSSPEKDSQNGFEDDEDEESDEEPMDIDESEQAPSSSTGRPPESHSFSERDRLTRCLHLSHRSSAISIHERQSLPSGTRQVAAKDQHAVPSKAKSPCRPLIFSHPRVRRTAQ